MFTQKQIEAAAKAILKARYVYPDGEWENCGSEDRAGAMDEAKAALEAAEAAAWEAIDSAPKDDWFLVLEKVPVKDMPRIDIVHSTSVQNVSGKPFTHWRPLPPAPKASD